MSTRVEVVLPLSDGTALHFDREVEQFIAFIGTWRVELLGDELTVRDASRPLNDTMVLVKVSASPVSS